MVQLSSVPAQAGSSNAQWEVTPESLRLLRQQLQMTQESFAHEIGVTSATVNRWENGRTTPNKVAQKVLKLMEKKLRKMRRAP